MLGGNELEAARRSDGKRRRNPTPLIGENARSFAEARGENNGKGRRDASGNEPAHYGGEEEEREKVDASAGRWRHVGSNPRIAEYGPHPRLRHTRRHGCCWRV
ncbi:hypothetical protein MTO96_000843 [Rhipicephalus appendiculatus]